jgi:hypothetical protein
MEYCQLNCLLPPAGAKQLEMLVHEYFGTRMIHVWVTHSVCNSHLTSDVHSTQVRCMRTEWIYYPCSIFNNETLFSWPVWMNHVGSSILNRDDETILLSIFTVDVTVPADAS